MRSSKKLSVVILAAGLGSRLGKNHPKSMTPLADGELILARSLRILKEVLGSDIDIYVVLGFKGEMIEESFPQIKSVWNSKYDQTNTSKSLLLSLSHVPKSHDILWLNGDLVFDRLMLESIVSFWLNNQISFLAGNQSKVSDEEIKYVLDSNGLIKFISKEVPISQAFGEAVGLNIISRSDRSVFSHYLNKVGNNDYYEKAIEISAVEETIKWKVVDYSSYGGQAYEVDFPSDLENANQQMFASNV